MVQPPDGDGIGHHLLDVGKVKPVRQLLRAGAGEGQAAPDVRQLGQQLLQQTAHALDLLRPVPLVVGIRHSPSFIHRRDFCGGGADVNAYMK